MEWTLTVTDAACWRIFLNCAMLMRCVLAAAVCWTAVCGLIDRTMVVGWRCQTTMTNRGAARASKSAYHHQQHDGRGVVSVAERLFTIVLKACVCVGVR